MSPHDCRSVGLTVGWSVMFSQKGGWLHFLDPIGTFTSYRVCMIENCSANYDEDSHVKEIFIFRTPMDSIQGQAETIAKQED